MQEWLFPIVATVLAVAALAMLITLLVLLAKQRREMRELETAVDQRMDLLTTGVQSAMDNATQLQMSLLNMIRGDISDGARTQRETTEHQTNQLNEALNQTDSRIYRQLSDMNDRIERLQKGTGEAIESLRQENERQLNEMRKTVDEKLNESLNRSLGENYKQVAERLEALQKSLGEMSTLTTSVSSLNRMMSNVKTRGTWSEVQLQALLEQVLVPGQYERNVHIIPGGRDVVEFAIVLPGQGNGKTYLPLDSKFPMEDYLRLVDASAAGDAEGVENAQKAIKRRILDEAKDIHSKYIHPPVSTDFGILYLGTESLYAEAARMPGLLEQVQREYRVMLAGPSNLAALLNSLQMGFQTVAVQEQAAEMRSLVSAISADFDAFAAALATARNKLRLADESIESAEKKTKGIVKDLNKVKNLPADQSHGRRLLQLPDDAE